MVLASPVPQMPGFARATNAYPLPPVASTCSLTQPDTPVKAPENGRSESSSGVSPALSLR